MYHKVFGGRVGFLEDKLHSRSPLITICHNIRTAAFPFIWFIP